MGASSNLVAKRIGAAGRKELSLMEALVVILLGVIIKTKVNIPTLAAKIDKQNPKLNPGSNTKH